MPAKKSDRQIATERRETLALAMLDLPTGDRLDPDAIYHFGFAANVFQVEKLLDFFLADFSENLKDLKAELCAAIALAALRRII